MFDGLDKYGLPAKYAVIGTLGGLLGSLIAQMLTLHGGGLTSHLITMVATGVGGAIGGWIRQRRGLTN